MHTVSELHAKVLKLSRNDPVNDWLAMMIFHLQRWLDPTPSNHAVKDVWRSHRAHERDFYRLVWMTWQIQADW